MHYRLMIISLLVMGLALIAVPIQAQDAPDQIQMALDDLSNRAGTDVTLNDLTRYTYDMRQFNNTSLGCPQPDEGYAEVITPGYQFTLVYDGQRYDYRVSEDQSIMVFCSVESTDGAPDDPTRRQMDQPIVAVMPLATTPGSTVQVVANGFPRNTSVIIGVGLIDSEYDVVRSLQSNNQGLVEAQITIPGYFDTQQQVVVVVETDDSSLRVVSFPLLLTDTDIDGGVSGNPSVTLSATAGAPGTTLQLTATGYPPNSNVLIGVGPQNSPDFAYSLRETTTDQGNLTTEIAIPDNAQINRPYIALVELEADRTYEATSPVFIPTGTEPTPPPEGDEFTAADIYLIATGDAGQNGVLIGCNDSAIPVQVNFAPTPAPLTAALEQLLNLNTRLYGQSGLYNALYQSDLTLDSIDLVNGTATINLSGNLQIGGACDAPRVEAQIRQTALQFGTIDAVNITVNGQPIEQLLTGQ